MPQRRRSRRNSPLVQLGTREVHDLHAIWGMGGNLGLTLPTVTKLIPVIDWTKFKLQWPDLPKGTSAGQVDILLGLNYGHLMAIT